MKCNLDTLTFGDLLEIIGKILHMKIQKLENINRIIVEDLEMIIDIKDLDRYR
jgi:hypothetical protein